MKWIATALLVFLAVGGAVYFLTRNSQQQPPSRVLEDRSFVINGRPTTCGELIQQPCEFRLQTEYNRVGDRLESFLYSSALGSFATDTGFAAELGPFASDISFAAAAKLSLQAANSQIRQERRFWISSSSVDSITRMPVARSSLHTGTGRERGCVP